jgi:hypothetical protein
LRSIRREISGVEGNKSFGILVEAKGGGARRARLSPESPTSRVIAVIGKRGIFEVKAK